MKVNNKDIPNWFLKWWISYGPSIEIFPEPFKALYAEWVKISPRLIDDITKYNGGQPQLSSYHFFTEFSIPWIWKWIPEVDYTTNQFPSIQRIFLTKFWPKMITKDLETGEMYSKDVIDQIHEAIKKYTSQKII